MKKLLCSGLALFLLVSCQEDDSNKTNPIATKGSNYVATQTQYDDLTGEVESINQFKYTNGRPDVFNFYTPDNKLEETTKFVYDSDNKVVEVKSYNPQNISLGNFKYTYDNQDRITTIVGAYVNYASQYTFTYNNDKTITGKQTSSDGYEATKTWYVNNDGLIYKEVDESGNSYELTFNGKNTASAKSDSGDIKTFEYDTEHDMSLIGNLTVYGDYLPNQVLQSYYLQDSETSTATNYLVKEISDGVVSRTNKWEFDTAGRPSKNTATISNGKLISVTTYKFE